MKRFEGETVARSWYPGTRHSSWKSVARFNFAI
jgi:hypothetical protein